MNMIYVLQMNGEQDWEYEEIPLERVSNISNSWCPPLPQLNPLFINKL